MSLMAGRLLATSTTSAPMRSSSRAKGSMPSTTSAPALSTNMMTRWYGLVTLPAVCAWTRGVRGGRGGGERWVQRGWPRSAQQAARSKQPQPPPATVSTLSPPPPPHPARRRPARSWRTTPRQRRQSRPPARDAGSAACAPAGGGGAGQEQSWAGPQRAVQLHASGSHCCWLPQVSGRQAARTAGSAGTGPGTCAAQAQRTSRYISRMVALWYRSTHALAPQSKMLAASTPCARGGRGGRAEQGDVRATLACSRRSLVLDS